MIIYINAAYPLQMEFKQQATVLLARKGFYHGSSKIKQKIP